MLWTFLLILWRLEPGLLSPTIVKEVEGSHKANLVGWTYKLMVWIRFASSNISPFDETLEVIEQFCCATLLPPWHVAHILLRMRHQTRPLMHIPMNAQLSNCYCKLIETTLDVQISERTEVVSCCDCFLPKNLHYLSSLRILPFLSENM